ncbi:hypothetical protein ABBQ32_006845 [Trebouxia sp. C0010 RCD-2024]
MAVGGDEHPSSCAHWLSHQVSSQVAAIIRLLQFKTAMGVVLVRRKDGILDTLAKKDHRDKADAILSVAQRDSFWSALAHLVCCPSGLHSDFWSQTQRGWTLCLSSLATWPTILATATTGWSAWKSVGQRWIRSSSLLHLARMLQHINPDVKFAYANNIVNMPVSYTSACSRVQMQRGQAVQADGHIPGHARGLCQQPPQLHRHQ